MRLRPRQLWNSWRSHTSTRSRSCPSSRRAASLGRRRNLQDTLSGPTAPAPGGLTPSAPTASFVAAPLHQHPQAQGSFAQLGPARPHLRRPPHGLPPDRQRVGQGPRRAPQMPHRLLRRPMMQEHSHQYRHRDHHRARVRQDSAGPAPAHGPHHPWRNTAPVSVARAQLLWRQRCSRRR